MIKSELKQKAFRYGLKKLFTVACLRPLGTTFQIKKDIFGLESEKAPDVYRHCGYFKEIKYNED